MLAILPLYVIGPDGYVVKIFRCFHYKRMKNAYSALLIKCTKHGFLIIKSFLNLIMFIFFLGMLTSSWAHLSKDNDDSHITWASRVPES